MLSQSTQILITHSYSMVRGENGAIHAKSSLSLLSSKRTSGIFQDCLLFINHRLQFYEHSSSKVQDYSRLSRSSELQRLSANLCFVYETFGKLMLVWARINSMSNLRWNRGFKLNSGKFMLAQAAN